VRAAAIATTVIIDVFRAFTTAAIALSRGARRIIMVDTLDKALALRSSGVGDYCIGERDSTKPPGFDFGNSPAEFGVGRGGWEDADPDREQRDGRDQRSPRGRSHLRGRLRDRRSSRGAILRHAPTVVTLVAIGRSNGTIRADEDELCALYLRARLEGRQPDVAAIRAVLANMPPPPDPKLVAAGAYDLKDREIAAEVDAIAVAISVRREGGLLIAEAERNDLLPAS